jgi:hypothetical protein
MAHIVKDADIHFVFIVTPRAITKNHVLLNITDAHIARNLLDHLKSSVMNVGLIYGKNREINKILEVKDAKCVTVRK